jgi:hypothetical protein
MDQLQTPTHADSQCLPGSVVEITDHWSVWKAARRLLSPELTPHLLHGLTGGAIRRHDDALIYNDLTEWIAPGLATLDIRVEPLPLPHDKAECAALLRACLLRGRTVPVLLYGERETAATLPAASLPMEIEAEEEGETEGEEGIAAEAPLLRQRLALEAVQGLDEIRVVDEAGRRQTVGVSWLLAGTAVALRLTRRPHQGTRRAGLRAALRRWAVFSAACPERLITPYAEDEPRRTLAAAFLREAAGMRGDRARGLLRRAADGLERAIWPEDIQDAFDYIRASVCLEFRLTPTEQDALISPPTHLLSDIERRELIYLARAGVRDLRVLAARRLATEQGHDDARRTLEQLRYDPDTWVRAVCIPVQPEAHPIGVVCQKPSTHQYSSNG